MERCQSAKGGFSGRKGQGIYLRLYNLWRGARVVEWAALEMRCTRKGTGSSNPPLSAKIRNSNFRQKYGRREAPSVLHSPQKTLNQKGFSTLRVAQKVRFDP